MEERDPRAAQQATDQQARRTAYTKHRRDTRGARGQKRPTQTDISEWPPTVSVEDAARAMGISRAHAYRLIDKGQFPIESEMVGNRRVVFTESLLRWLRMKL